MAVRAKVSASAGASGCSESSEGSVSTGIGRRVYAIDRRSAAAGRTRVAGLQGALQPPAPHPCPSHRSRSFRSIFPSFMTKKTLSVSRMSRERIARDGHDVGELSRLQRAEPVGEAEELGGGRGAGPESRRRRHAGRRPSCENSSRVPPRAGRLRHRCRARSSPFPSRAPSGTWIWRGGRTRRGAFSATRRGDVAPRSSRSRIPSAAISVGTSQVPLRLHEGRAPRRRGRSRARSNRCPRADRAHRPSAPCAWAAAFLLSAWASSTSASSSACVSCGALTSSVSERTLPSRAGLDDVRPGRDILRPAARIGVGAVGDGVLDPGAPVEEGRAGSLPWGRNDLPSRRSLKPKRACAAPRSFLRGSRSSSRVDQITRADVADRGEADARASFARRPWRRAPARRGSSSGAPSS